MTEVTNFVRDVAERASRRGPAEREWLAEWQQAFDAALAEHDEQGIELLLDTLVAFDRWQRSNSPYTTGPRRCAGRRRR